MKKLFSSLTAAFVLAGALAAGGALAESDGYVYGTMRIPYDAFYASEGVRGAVDAVTSATNGKWKNENLVAGTYSQPHDSDEGGDILGVVYPVAITQEDLDQLGEDNYGFAAGKEMPEAYKKVSVEHGEAVFSAVQGASSALEAEASISVNTAYGDYAVDVNAIHNADGSSDVGTIRGVLLKTEDGAVYGLRHLENIWRDELAWSVGFVTEERHGNVLSSSQYADMMGKTISEITYITETGYHTLAVSLYVPVKFEGGVSVADAPVSGGVAAMTLTGLPEDYAPEYAVENLSFRVSETGIDFENAMPGKYTMTVTDANGKYAELRADFVLSTGVLPVVFDAESGALTAAEGADAALAETFIANISTVSVNGTEYRASGKGAVAIVDGEGVIDREAAVVSGRGAEAVSTPVFAQSGEYTLTVSATGFDQSIEFAIQVEE